MSRIRTVTNEEASESQLALLDAVQAKLGMVPNFLRVFANSPAALQAFLGLHEIAGSGELDEQTRERIAVTLAQENSCEYCLSARSAIGRKAGLNNDEIHANRQGTSHNDKAAVAVKLARSLSSNVGDVTTAEITEAKEAGFSDAEIVEIITHVGMNLLTNVLAKASHVDIDFPKVSLQVAA